MTAVDLVWAEPTEYTVCAVPRTYPEWDGFRLRVVPSGAAPGMWVVVTRLDRFLTNADRPRDRPQGVSKWDPNIRHARMPLDAALDLARVVAPKLRAHHLTPVQYMAWYDALPPKEDPA